MDETVARHLCHAGSFAIQDAWSSEEPVFSSCFYNSIFYLPLALYVFLYVPLRVISLLLSPKIRLSPRLFFHPQWDRSAYYDRSSLHLSQLLSMVALLLVSLLKFILVIGENNWSFIGVIPAVIVSRSIEVTTFTIGVVMICWHRHLAIHTSPSLTFVSFFYLIASSFHLILTWTQSSTFSLSEVYLINAQFVASLCNFISQCFSTYRHSSYTRLLEGADDKPNPYLSASTVSRVTFTFMNDLIFKGWRNDTLVASDLPSLMPNHRSNRVFDKFNRIWNKLRESSVSFIQKKGNVLLTLVRVHGVYYSVAVLADVFVEIGVLASPIILKWLLAHLEDTDHYIPWHGYLIVTALFTVFQLQSFFQNFFSYRITSLAVLVRSALVSMIYRKSLRISSVSRGDSTTGEIVTLMSVDADRFTFLITWLDTLWSAPLRITVSIYFIYQEIGASVFAGVAVVLILIPFSVLVSKYMKKVQTEQMKQKDERIKLTNELLNGIKVIKLYAWEKSFTQLIEDIRNIELSKLQRLAYSEAISMFTFSSTPMLVALSSFLTYMLSDPSHRLDAKKAFISLAYFNIMRIPLTNLPYIFIQAVTSRVSISRLNRFLNLPELEKYVTHNQDEFVVRITAGGFNYGAGVSMSDKKKQANATSQTNPDENNGDTAQLFELRNIDMKIKESSLVAIVGRVGSGKSSLMSAILGEMEKISGSVNIAPGNPIAYVSQQAWIQNDTLRNNILFGEAYDESKYNRIISACQLLPDLAILPSGDLTEIGEKGINLSGGQKQRLALARACYSSAKLFILDDPLSAVDAHVAKNLYNEVLSTKTGLLGTKTRLLVTNDISLLPNFDDIYVMVDGTISESGKFDQLMADAGQFSTFVNEFASQKETSKAQGPTDPEQVEQGESEPGDSKEQTTAPADDRSKNKESARLIRDEQVKAGKISWKVYLIFFKSIALLPVTVLCFMLTQAFDAGDNYWLSLWASDGNSTDAQLATVRISVYAGLGVGQVASILVGSLLFARGLVACATKMHQSLLYGVLRAPMSFFDTTPSGRIVNRFSKDIDTIDESLPNILNFWMMIIIRTVATFFVIIFVSPLLILVIIPVCILHYFIQKVFVPTNRQLRRIMSATRSPVYSNFSETLTGVSTIRAYNAQSRFISNSDDKLDITQSASFASVNSNRWLAIRLQFIGNCVILAVALISIIERDSLSPALAGLSITYAMSITQLLNWIITMTADVETNIVSVERVVEFTTSELQSEAEWDTSPGSGWPQTPPGWPMHGAIEFKSYSTRYRENLDLVLKDLNLTIRGGEKVGIVGRTGAGKSSIALSIFRLIEPASGTIEIDGFDVTKMGLHKLREALTIIPQDPVLFSGKLRINLDPFNKYSDAQLWRALELAHLRDFVNELDGGLEYEITEGGANLSVGQRQLVCLARALLKKTKILVLDEATAAVDLQTDSLIQSTVRSEFSHCTILTIAHRLNTIMDSDRILVLDNGCVAEFAPPKQLLDDESSQFRSLAKDAGLV